LVNQKRTGEAVELRIANNIHENEKKLLLYHHAYEIGSHKLLASIPSEQILINKLEQNPAY